MAFFKTVPWCPTYHFRLSIGCFLVPYPLVENLVGSNPVAWILTNISTGVRIYKILFLWGRVPKNQTERDFRMLRERRSGKSYASSRSCYTNRNVSLDSTKWLAKDYREPNGSKGLWSWVFPVLIQHSDYYTSAQHLHPWFLKWDYFLLAIFFPDHIASFPCMHRHSGHSPVICTANCTIRFDLGWQYFISTTNGARQSICIFCPKHLNVLGVYWICIIIWLKYFSMFKAEESLTVAP